VDLPVAGVAFDLPATRRSIRRILLFGLCLLAAALVLLGLSVWVWVGDRANHELQRDGVRSAATVASRSIRYVGRDRQPVGSITVMLDKGTARPTIPVGTQVLHFHTGQHVTVVHRAGGSEYQVLGIVPDVSGVPLAVPLVLGVVLAGAAFLSSRHGRLARRVTKAHRWVAVPATVVEVPYSTVRRQRSQSVLAIRGLDDRSIIVEPVGLRRLNPTFQPVVWTAGVADRRFVVSPPGGGRVLCVQEVRRARPRGGHDEPDPDAPPIA
jgi:hypothetical protein